MKNIHRLIAIILIATFIAHEASWAYPEFPQNKSNNISLAPAPFAERHPASDLFATSIILLVEKNPVIPIDKLTLEGLHAILKKNGGFFKHNGISYSINQNEARIRIDPFTVMRYSLAVGSPDPIKGLKLSSEGYLGILKRQVWVSEEIFVDKKWPISHSGDADSIDTIDSDATNLFIMEYIAQGKAIELDDNSENVIRIRPDGLSQIDDRLSSSFRNYSDIFTKVRDARSVDRLDRILENTNFDGYSSDEKKELRETAQSVSLSLILGRSFICEDKKNGRVLLHVRTGLNGTIHGLKPTIWIGEHLLKQINTDELARILLEESQHIVRPVAHHWEKRFNENPAETVKHDDRFMDNLYGYTVTDDPMTRVIMHDLKNELVGGELCELYIQSAPDKKKDDILADLNPIEVYQMRCDGMQKAIIDYLNRNVTLEDALTSLMGSIHSLEVTTDAIQRRLDNGRYQWLGGSRDELRRMVVDRTRSTVLPSLKNVASWWDKAMDGVNIEQTINDGIRSVNDRTKRIDFGADVYIDDRLKRSSELFTYEFILRLALKELLFNAAKNDRTGRAKVTVSLTEYGEIKITVRNNSVEIGPDSIGKIFNVSGFTTAGSGKKGTGVGLYDLKEVVESVGGSMWVESKPGQGATFGFTLPVKASMEALPRPMLKEPVVVVVSGLKGSGRRVIAHSLAARLGLRYINSGLLVRVIFHEMLKANIDTADKDNLAEFTKNLLSSGRLDYSRPILYVDGKATIDKDSDEDNSLRDTLRSEIDEDAGNRWLLHTIFTYPSVNKALNEFYERLANDVKGSGQYNGIVLSVTVPIIEPIEAHRVINIMLDAPVRIRALRTNARAELIMDLDDYTGRSRLKDEYASKIPILNTAVISRNTMNDALRLVVEQLSDYPSNYDDKEMWLSKLERLILAEPVAYEMPVTVIAERQISPEAPNMARKGHPAVRPGKSADSRDLIEAKAQAAFKRFAEFCREDMQSIRALVEKDDLEGARTCLRRIVAMVGAEFKSAEQEKLRFVVEDSLNNIVGIAVLPMKIIKEHINEMMSAEEKVLMQLEVIMSEGKLSIVDGGVIEKSGTLNISKCIPNLSNEAKAALAFLDYAVDCRKQINLMRRNIVDKDVNEFTEYIDAISSIAQKYLGGIGLEGLHSSVREDIVGLRFAQRSDSVAFLKVLQAFEDRLNYYREKMAERRLYADTRLKFIGLSSTTQRPSIKNPGVKSVTVETELKDTELSRLFIHDIRSEFTVVLGYCNLILYAAQRDQAGIRDSVFEPIRECKSVISGESEKDYIYGEASIIGILNKYIEGRSGLKNTADVLAQRQQRLGRIGEIIKNNANSGLCDGNERIREYSLIVAQSISRVVELLQKSENYLDVGMRPINIKSVVNEASGYLGSVSGIVSRNNFDGLGKVSDIVTFNGLLRMALKELLTNASKYGISEKGIDVTASLIDGEKKLKVEVRDYGPGISKEILSKLFNTPGEDVVVDSAKGNGYGLFWLRSAIRSIGGDMLVESEIGGGACFSFTIPVKIVTHSQGRPGKDSPTFVPEAVRKKADDITPESRAPNQPMEAQFSINPSDWSVYVLAGGRGKRMGTTEDKPKPMVEVRGKPIYKYLLDKFLAIGLSATILTGFGAPALEKSIDDCYGSGRFQYSRDKEGNPIKSTGNTFLYLREKIMRAPGDNVLITNADDLYPNDHFIRAIISKHSNLVNGKTSDATVLAVHNKNPGNLGRIVRKSDGKFLEIVENGRLRDVNDGIWVGEGTSERRRMTEGEVKGIEEVNSNVIAFRKDVLLEILNQIGKDIAESSMAEREILIAEVLTELVRNGKTVRIATISDEDAFISCNENGDLLKAEEAVEHWDLDNIHGLLTVGLWSAESPVDDNAKILLSENLFGDEAALVKEQLEPLIKAGRIAILKPDKICNSARRTNGFTKSNSAIILTNEDYNEYGRGNFKTSILIVDDKLSGNNYLYLEGILGLTLAVMANNEQSVRRYYELISGKPISEGAMVALQKGNSIGFALQAILKFIPIIRMDPKELEARKAGMETFLVSA